MTFNIHSKSRMASALNAPEENGKCRSGPLSRLKGDELGLPFKERYFRDLVRCGQYKVVAENPVESLGKIGRSVNEALENPSKKYWGSELHREIMKLAAGDEWEKLGLLKGDIEYKIGAEYAGKKENCRYWWEEFSGEIASLGKTRASIPLMAKYGLRWLVYRYGSIHELNRVFDGTAQHMLAYGPAKQDNQQMLMQACDDFHESLRKKNGQLTLEDKLVLIKLEQGTPFTARDKEAMQRIYRDPKTWSAQDFGDADSTILFSRFERRIYNVARFQCSKWFELLFSKPSIDALFREIREYNRANGKRIAFSLTMGQELLLQKNRAMVELDGYKIRNRDGRWELHKTILPWEMGVSPHGWFKNNLLFRFDPCERISGKLGAWLESLQPEARKSVLELKDGEHTYFAHNWKEMHATKSKGQIEVEEDNRHMLVKFVNWAWEEKGITPYKLFGRTIHNIAPALEAHINNSIIIVKMAHPEIMPEDMRKMSTLKREGIREKALRIYPDWDKWFLHKYPQLAGRNDGIVEFGEKCVPAPMKGANKAHAAWKGKPLDAGSLPLPCFDGEDAALPFRSKVGKFFIEKVGAYSIHHEKAMLVDEVAQAVDNARKEAGRKGFVFSGKAEKAAVKLAVASMIEGGKCLELAAAGAISHGVPNWYVENIAHGRFWMQALADETCRGDIYKLSGSKIIEAGLSNYLGNHGMSPNNVLQHYFSGEIDSSRLRKKPIGLAFGRKRAQEAL